MIELFLPTGSMDMSDYGIRTGHGAHNAVLCQAVLTAKGGLKDAHFMRYVASKFTYRLVIWCNAISWCLHRFPWCLVQMNSFAIELEYLSD